MHTATKESKTPSSSPQSIKPSKIEKSLNYCSKEEIAFLQYLLKAYLLGKEALGVYEILSDIYGKEVEAYIDKIDMVASLISKSLIKESFFSDYGYGHKFSLIHSQVTLSPFFFEAIEANEPFSLPLKKAYSHIGDYLQDMFLKADIFKALITAKKQLAYNDAQDALEVSHLSSLKKQLKAIEEIIQRRMVLTKKRHFFFSPSYQ